MHIYIDFKTFVESPHLLQSIDNLYYTDYTIYVMNDGATEMKYTSIQYKRSVQETILSHAIGMPPNQIAIYLDPTVKAINDLFLFELNKWYLYKKCRASHIGTIWTCKAGVLREIVAQHGMENVLHVNLLPSIIDICGDKYVGAFDQTTLITTSGDTNNMQMKMLVCEPVAETIHVLLATYERNANIREVITQFQKQTFKNVHLHLLDNNVDVNIQSELDDILNQIRGGMKMTLHRPGWNSHCFGRITCVREIIEEHMLEYVVIFDDDQIFDANWIENMVRDRRPLSTLGWYGKLFNKCDYWVSTISYLEIQHKKRPHIKEFTYFGPGGCMLDINLFLFNEIYDYKKYSDDIIAIDDIWLSFVFKKYLNIRFHRNMIHPIKCIDWSDHTKMTWAKMKDTKKNLLTHLSSAYNWDVTKPTPKTFTVNDVFERVYVLYTSTDNKSRKLFNQMNICATYIPIERDIQTATTMVFKRLLQTNIQTVLVLYEDVIFDEFFHYKFNKYICDMPKEWDELNIDHIAHSKLTSIVGHTTKSMLDLVYQTSEFTIK
jgi:hypothetical protein